MLPVLALILILHILLPLKVQAGESITSMSGREARIKKNSSIIRLGASGSVFMACGSGELDKYTDDRLSIFIDVLPYSIKNRQGNGFDFYARYTFDSLRSDSGLWGNPDFYFLDP